MDTTDLPPFVSFPSISRLRRTAVLTEKIDGINAQIYVGEDGRVVAGSRSRSRWITPEDDNFGFARWVRDHEEELRVGLGIGLHYGEWWGAGIQRRYGLKEKRFSLFNVARWKGQQGLHGLHGLPEGFANDKQGLPPACCSVVPVLWEGEFDTGQIDYQLEQLRLLGSEAAPGFMQPEGVVVFHVPTGQLFKQTLEGDGHKTAKK